MKKEEFFKLIAAKNNQASPESAANFYYAIFRVVLDELRKNGSVRIPDWGEFRIVYHKERRSTDVNTGELVYLPQKATIKFSPCEKLKDYVRRM